MVLYSILGVLAAQTVKLVFQINSSRSKVATILVAFALIVAACQQAASPTEGQTEEAAVATEEPLPTEAPAVTEPPAVTEEPAVSEVSLCVSQTETLTPSPRGEEVDFADQGRLAAEHLSMSQGLSTLAIVYAADGLSLSIAEQAQSRFTSLGGEVNLFQDVDPNSQDFGDLLSELEEISPQAIFLVGLAYDEAASIFLNQMVDFGLLEGVFLLASSEADLSASFFEAAQRVREERGGIAATMRKIDEFNVDFLMPGDQDWVLAPGVTRPPDEILAQIIASTDFVPIDLIDVQSAGCDLSENGQLVLRLGAVIAGDVQEQLIGVLLIAGLNDSPYPPDLYQVLWTNEDVESPEMLLIGQNAGEIMPEEVRALAHEDLGLEEGQRAFVVTSSHKRCNLCFIFCGCLNC